MVEDVEGNFCGITEVLKNTTQNISGQSVSWRIFETVISP